MPSTFTVIRGGLAPAASARKYKFVSGTSTNTRLMGVLGIELNWTFTGEDEEGMLRQVFYLDCESHIVDTYTECVGEDSAEITKNRTRLHAALGGRIVPIEEKEARFLVQSYSYGEGSDHIKTEGQHGYAFILHPVQTLSSVEYQILAARLCCDLPSPYYAVNYYLMRCASLDRRGAAYLLGDFSFADPDRIGPKDQPENTDADIFGVKEPITLCQNKITTARDDSGDVVYLCESLTEREDGYTLSTAEMRICDTVSETPYIVKHAELTSEFHITDVESAMMMKRPEFVTVCDILDPGENFEEELGKLTAAFTETRYDNGRLFIDFKSNNDHVGNQLYRINDDIRAVFFLTDNYQLIIMSYSVRDAQYAEYRAILTLLQFDICVTMKYEFVEPVLYEFVNSDFEDFSEFLQFITVHNDDDDGK